MLEFIGLSPDCVCNLLIAMADANRHDAAKEIEILLSIHVDHGAALGMVNHKGLFVVVGHAREKVPFVLFNDLSLVQMASTPAHLEPCTL